MAYFANATHGDVLEAQCEDCPVGRACPVYLIHMVFNYDQLDAGQEKLREAMTHLVADNGECQVRKILKTKGASDAII